MSLQDLLLVPLGLVAGVYGTIIGAGGGFVLVPALLLLYRDKPADELTAITPTVALVSGVSAFVAYARQGRIDYLTAILMGCVAVPGGVLGVFAIHLLPRPVFDTVFGALLLVVGAIPGAQLGAFLSQRFASSTVSVLLIGGLSLVGFRLMLEGLILGAAQSMGTGLAVGVAGGGGGFFGTGNSSGGAGGGGLLGTGISDSTGWRNQVGVSVGVAVGTGVGRVGTMAAATGASTPERARCARKERDNGT